MMSSWRKEELDIYSIYTLFTLYIVTAFLTSMNGSSGVRSDERSEWMQNRIQWCHKHFLHPSSHSLLYSHHSFHISLPTHVIESVWVSIRHTLCYVTYTGCANVLSRYWWRDSTWVAWMEEERWRKRRDGGRDTSSVVDGMGDRRRFSYWMRWRDASLKSSLRSGMVISEVAAHSRSSWSNMEECVHPTGMAEAM